MTEAITADDLLDIANKLGKKRIELETTLRSIQNEHPLGEQMVIVPMEPTALIKWCDRCSEDIQTLRRTISDEKTRRTPESVKRETQRIAMNVQILGLLEDDPA